MEIIPFLPSDWPLHPIKDIAPSTSLVLEARPGSQKFRVEHIWVGDTPVAPGFLRWKWRGLERQLSSSNGSLHGQFYWALQFYDGRSVVSSHRRIFVLENIIACDVIADALPVRPILAAKGVGLPPQNTASQRAIPFWPRVPQSGVPGSSHARLSLISKLREDLPMLQKLACMGHERLSQDPILFF